MPDTMLTAPAALDAIRLTEHTTHSTNAKRRRKDHPSPVHSDSSHLASESPLNALQRARLRIKVPAEWRQRREASFASYVVLHKEFLRGSGHSSATGRSATHVKLAGRGSLPRRFLVVKPCCQLCNRVRVLVSALALGILTDRAVLIDFDGEGKGGAASHGDGYYGRFEDLFDSPLEVQARVPREVAGPSSVNAITSDGGGGRNLQWLTMMSDVLCMDPASWTEAVVTLQGSPAFLHSLFLCPDLRPKFEAAFGSGLEGLFAHIFHALMVPKPSITQQAAAFVNDLRGRNGEAFIVGLHVRNGRDFRTSKLVTQEWKQLAKCAKSLVPATGTQADGDERVPFRFVVATESGESRNAAAAALGTSAAFYKEALHKGKGGTTSREGAQRALLELLIVSMCDATVLTPMSSFSETAAALSGRPGLYFHFDLSRKFHYESATEAVAGCFVPWTSEMPGSMNLHMLLSRLPCRDQVSQLNAVAGWTKPTGLRFLDGRPSQLPEKMSKKVTAF